MQDTQRNSRRQRGLVLRFFVRCLHQPRLPVSLPTGFGAKILKLALKKKKKTKQQQQKYLLTTEYKQFSITFPEGRMVLNQLQIRPELHVFGCILASIISVTVSLRLSRKLHFWHDIRRIKVIKCPPDYNLWKDINSNPNLILKKKNPKQTLTLKLQTGGLRLDFAGNFLTFTKIKRASSRCISGQK